MAEPDVADEEVFFRRVQWKPELYSTNGGTLRLSSSAFNDSAKQPSVNRARVEPDPAQTKFEESDGVVELIASEVRRSVVPCDAHGPHASDVIPRPIQADLAQGIKENLAHCQIEAQPPFCTDSRFKKLKEALARAAEKRGWRVQPGG